ncbi:S-adenosyl-L-methionine-dependent methyltransferase [Mycotypha africana]|uniref:S-adenosyl-L-methionine-dependent methyltransferase n=1 Tax=Mycotypha africana TaxID=64632 RepID=UPI002301418D|nr:S-adenosyl-L-methionine-dependent methyltransferase [Mycotypha africana]KAI8991356.1 S-adenosyl-L-methionine-dependent methyltransferase [Mycotypha africana]
MTSAFFFNNIYYNTCTQQHFSIKALFDGNILSSVLNRLPPNAQVLDLGCGSGCWVMDMAIDYPHFQFIGVDMADMFPTAIRPENVKFQLQNILQGLPFPDNTFDFVHMRLLIIAFQKKDWPWVLSEIYRVLKPGGIVQLMESDFTEKTNVPIVEKFNNEFIKAMLDLEQDPWIGSKLSHLLEEQNFQVVELKEKYLDYKLPLNPISKEMLTNWKDAMLSIRPMLAHRFESADYNAVVDQYIDGITQAGWKVKLWALCGQKKE